MARRKTVNVTKIKRLHGISPHDAWISYTCLKCSHRNYINVGHELLDPTKAFEEGLWKCDYCGYIHSQSSDLPNTGTNGEDLPYKAWGPQVTSHTSIAAQRLWKAFFTIATQNKESYWKQCNMCGKILPASAFSRHTGWGPLEKQMECRSCKAVINANLNPKRTKEQLHESSLKRRMGDLLMEGENEPIDFRALFERFGGRCFKTGKRLDFKDRKSWEVDHLLPSRYLYPLRKDNAVLLSREANANKRDRWPSEFYTNQELKKLAKLLGANLAVISSKKPLINPNINVDRCVDRMLDVRDATDLAQRTTELKKMLSDYKLVNKLSPANKKLLGVK